MGFWDTIGKASPAYWLDRATGGHGADALRKGYGQLTGEGGMLGDPKGTDDRLNTGAAANEFAGYGEDRFRAGGNAMSAQVARMQKIRDGEESVSKLQLQQALGQNIAQQQSMAASARPGSGAMAGRTAMMNAGRAAAGLGGQQAIAGIQERQAAQAAMNKMLSDMRQQDLMAALQSRGNAVSAFNPNGASGSDKQASALQSLFSAGAAAVSDKRLKSNIRDADDDAEEFIKSLKAYKFDYKDAEHGKGEQLGIMAQDLGKSKHGRQALIETKEGLAVHGAKLSTALAASLPRMLSRIEQLEGKK